MAKAARHRRGALGEGCKVKFLQMAAGSRSDSAAAASGNNGRRGPSEGSRQDCDAGRRGLSEGSRQDFDMGRRKRLGRGEGAALGGDRKAALKKAKRPLEKRLGSGQRKRRSRFCRRFRLPGPGKKANAFLDESVGGLFAEGDRGVRSGRSSLHKTSPEAAEETFLYIFSCNFVRKNYCF